MAFGTRRWTAGQQCQWTCYWPCEMAAEVNLCKHAYFSLPVCLFNQSHIARAAGCELRSSEAVRLLASVLVPQRSLKVLLELDLQLHSK